MYIKRDLVNVETSGMVILKQRVDGKVAYVKSEITLYSHDCPKCQCPMTEGREERFQGITGHCFQCHPWVGTFWGKAIRIVDIKSREHYIQVVRECHELDPHGIVETNVYKTQIYWTHDTAQVFIRTRYGVTLNRYPENAKSNR